MKTIAIKQDIRDDEIVELSRLEIERLAKEQGIDHVVLVGRSSPVRRGDESPEDNARLLEIERIVKVSGY